MSAAETEGVFSTPACTEEGETLSLDEQNRRDRIEIKRLLDKIGTKNATRCLQRFHALNKWGHVPTVPKSYADLVAEIGTTYTLLCLRQYLKDPNIVLTR